MYRPGCSKHLPTSLRKISNLKFLNIWNNWQKSTFSNFQISNVSISEKCKNIFKIFRKLFGKCLELSERRTLYFRMGCIVKLSKEPIIIQPFHFVMMIFTFSGCPGSMENHGEPTYFPWYLLVFGLKMKAEFGLPVVSPDIHTQFFDMAKLKRAIIIGYTDTFTTNPNQK